MKDHERIVEIQFDHFDHDDKETVITVERTCNIVHQMGPDEEGFFSINIVHVGENGNTTKLESFTKVCYINMQTHDNKKDDNNNDLFPNIHHISTRKQ